MAKFVINSGSNQAIRKDEVDIVRVVSIISQSGTTYELRVGTIGERGFVFETDTTLDGIQAKAATVLAALEG